MSVAGWGLLFLGMFATAAFVVGVVSGEVLFLLTLKGKSGPMQVSYASSPFWYYVCMIINFVIAICVWILFFAWFQEHRDRGLSRNFRNLSSAPKKTNVNPP